MTNIEQTVVYVFINIISKQTTNNQITVCENIFYFLTTEIQKQQFFKQIFLHARRRTCYDLRGTETIHRRSSLKQTPGLRFVILKKHQQRFFFVIDYFIFKFVSLFILVGVLFVFLGLLHIFNINHYTSRQPPVEKRIHPNHNYGYQQPPNHHQLSPIGVR